MKRNISGLIAILLLPFLSWSCAQQQKPAQTAQPAELRPIVEDVIALHLKGDPQVNLYNGMSHALHLCVYQLSDPNAFNQFSEDEMGLSKLMNCERFDAGVALSKRIIIQPGEDRVFQLDRAVGAKYVGIVAGYYALNKRNVVRLYRIPGAEGGTQMRQAPLSIELYLGPQALRELGERP